ncbi:unnamed protein product [Cochlearia groenlandica]
MQGERTSLGYLSETLNFEPHGSSSSNGMIDHWESHNNNNNNSHGDNDLRDYLIANFEPNTSNANNNNTVYLEQNRFSHHGEVSSSVQNEQQRESNGYFEQQRNNVIDLDPVNVQPDGTNQLHEENTRSGFFEANGPVNMVSQHGSFGSCVEGRRGSFKRKDLECSIGQSSSGSYGGESSSWTPQASSSVYRPGNGLIIPGSITRRTVSVPAVSAVTESSSRQQETVNPLSVFSAGTVLRRPVTPLSLRDFCALNTSSSTTNPAIGIPSSVSRTMVPQYQWTNGGASIAPARLETPVFVSPPHGDLVHGSSSLPRTSSGGVGVQQQQPSSSSWSSPYHNLPHLQRRRSELVRNLRYNGSLAPPASSERLVLPPPPPPSQMQNRTGPWFNRQGDPNNTMVGVPHPSSPSRGLAANASRRRNRLMVSQMQNALHVMRRDPNNNLRFEDVMLLNQSAMFNGSGAHSNTNDRYRDMRLDVDNMSYEELLALEERMGDVCTGLNDETISSRLTQRKYKNSTKSTKDAEPCCICQEEYNEGEDMGRLECGHEFHSQCIKEWLKQKNLCPICKTKGLNTAKKRKIK